MSSSLICALSCRGAPQPPSQRTKLVPCGDHDYVPVLAPATDKNRFRARERRQRQYRAQFGEDGHASDAESQGEAASEGEADGNASDENESDAGGEVEDEEEEEEPGDDNLYDNISATAETGV